MIREGAVYPFVIIFDQMEELFQPYIDNWRKQQADFFKQIADALDRYSNLSIVFIIQEDYLALLDHFTKILSKRKSRFRLENLNKVQSIAAIKGPLTNIINNMDEQEKRKIEKEIKELVDFLLAIYPERFDGSVKQLEDDFIEPIHLQVVCSIWWNKRKEISLSKYQGNEVGGNSNLGLFTNVFEALEYFYEQSILKASEETGVSEREIRDWCQQKLITSIGTRSMIHRDRDTTGGLSNQVTKILEDMYLIRRQWRTGSSWYELTHDRMISAVLDSNRRWINKRSKIKEFKRYFSIGKS